jgi:hypothetical protein
MLRGGAGLGRAVVARLPPPGSPVAAGVLFGRAVEAGADGGEKPLGELWCELQRPQGIVA